MNPAVAAHHTQGPSTIRVAVLTISDTRTPETDTSGRLVADLTESAGHQVVDRAIVPDEPDAIQGRLVELLARGDVDAALLTGGTGISQRDRTFETVSALLTTQITGYGELFRMLSYAEIGPACILSRALGGLYGPMVVLTMPGSRAAVELAMTRIILPELPHLVGEARKPT